MTIFDYLSYYHRFQCCDCAFTVPRERQREGKDGSAEHGKLPDGTVMRRYSVKLLANR